MSITIAITSITCCTALILSQLQSYNIVHHFHHHRNHVFHMHYSFDPITMSITSITIAITSITCISASILQQCPSTSPSRLSHVLQLRCYKNVHHHRHHVYHMHYSFNLRTISITIAITSITCITASIL